SGLPFDAPGVRVARFAEAVQILEACFAGDGPVTFHGRFYRIDGLEPQPRRRPRLLIAGMRSRMLQLAARHADIVGLEDHQFAERSTGSVSPTIANCAEQVAIVRQAAGARLDEIELNVFAARTEVTDSRAAAVDRLANQLRLTPSQIDASPSFLLGTGDAAVRPPPERRPRLGCSYRVSVPRVMAGLAPAVARLAGCQ